jgi:hypothetical protein
LIDGLYTNLDYNYSISTPPSINFNHSDFPHLKDLISSTKRDLELFKNRVKPESVVAVIAASQSAIAEFSCSKPDCIDDVCS